jgi:hypothetical protein
MDPAWVTAAVASATLAGAMLLFATRWTWKVLSRVARFLDDYYGEPERPGQPARPGVMTRLGSLENVQAKILSELTMNGGRSVRDVVYKTAADVADIKAEQSRALREES